MCSKARNPRFARCLPLVFIVVLLAGLLATPVRAQAPPATFTRVISTASQSLTVDFALHPIRNANFAVLVQQSDGSLSAFTPDVPRTYLGTVQGRPGAIACGLLRADGTLLARIGFEDGTTWTTTGGTASASGSGFTPAWPTSVVASGGAGSAVFAAEYGFDSTFNHFTACGGTAAGVLEQIEFSSMSANMVYLRDAAILHRIGKVVVRADQTQDPYATDDDTNKLLTRVGTVWQAAGTPMGSTHDLAAVLHSEVNGGLAWVGAVGTSNRYSANDSDGDGDFSVVWRHEAGHNWGSNHYEGGGNPEGSTIMSNNALSRFSSSELLRIINHRNSRSPGMLDNLGAYTFPLPPRANQDATSYLVTGATKIDVLANDSDSNGQALSLHSFAGTSAFGGTLSRSTGTGPGGRDEILYNPPPVLTAGTDWFTYRIQDSAGMQAVGYVVLRPTSEIVTPVDHWTLDDSAGTTAVNLIRTTKNGTHQNGTVVNQTGANVVTRRGASFDGTNDQTSISSPGYSTNTLTFTTWVKRNGSQAAWAPLVFTRAGSSVAGLHFGTANELRYTWDDGNYNWDSGITVPDNTWCLAVMSVSPTGTTLHLRTPTGLQSATNTATHASEAFNGTMYLGYDSTNVLRHFKGWLDDVRVYKSTFTATQVESLYQQALNAPSVQLTAPTAGSSISPLNINLAASVTTLAAITSQVDFIENESSLASAPVAPWTAQLAALAPGAHTLTARASYGDWGYQIDSAPVSFTALPPPLPVVTVSSSLSASKRGPIPGSFTFTRSHPIGSITVPFTRSGTAIPGTDYIAIPNDVTIPDGSLSQTITVDPIAASPDGISETITLTLSSGASYSLGSPSAATLTIDDHITSIAAGEWDVGTTWNSGVPAPISGTQNTGEGYAVAHTVTSNDSASNSQALVAKSLRIQPGGILDLYRVHNSGGETITYNLPSTTVEDDGTLQFRCSNGSSFHNVAAGVSFGGATTLKITGGNYDNDANLTGALTGNGTISVVSDTGAGGSYVRQLSVNSSNNNSFAGNWTVNHSGGGTQSAALRAGAANALGTGTVTVGTRALLINDNATGLNSLAGIVLNGTSATLQLNQPWSNASASLSLAGGSPLVQLGNAASSIGNLSGQFGTIQGSGGSSSLTVNQSTDREFTAGVGTNLRFTKSGPAALTLAGSLHSSLVMTLANGTLVFADPSVITSFTQSGGFLRMDLPASPATVPLTVSGNYTRTAGTIAVDVTSIPQANVAYTLLRYQGTRTGTPTVTVNDSSGSGLVATVSNGTASNSAITVVFSTPPPQYTLTYGAGANGTLSGTTPQTVIQGASGSAVTATANAGYHFVNWSDGSTANPRTDSNVTGNLSVTANFAVNTYTLTYTAGADGTLSGTSPQTVNHGAGGSAVTAVANAGHHFVNWSDGSTANPRTDTNITGNLNVTANFAINTYTLAYTAGSNGTLGGTTPQTVNYGASGSAITATPNTGYHFVNWSDGSTANPRTDTSVTGNLSVTANFAINTYTLAYTAGANGTLGGTTPQTVTHGTSGNPIIATPNTGYHFVSWSDGSIANPRTDTNVTGNLSVTANFAIDTFTLTYTAGANGTLTGITPQTVNYGDSSSAVTAVPDSGYAFTEWSDGSTANPRTDTNVTANLTVTANFTATGPGPIPAPWTEAEIGTVAATTSATYLNGTFNVTGGGANISGKNDSFYFVSQPWSGTGTITARVVSLQNTGTAARAGVMMRESSASGSRSVFIGLTPANSAQWVRRSNTGGNSSATTSSGKPAPYWVRLTREGNTFTSYMSSNGTTWTQLASANISMSASYSLGMAACSGASDTTVASVFDNVSVSSTLPPPPEVNPTTPEDPLPKIEAFTLEDGTVDFNVTGEATGLWTLEESTDFVTWSPLQTMTLEAGGLQHSEADERGEKRFLRLKSEP
ncbi:InlB B-repeat-containing protein [Luteolibacter arcticus]|uniref:InlB B-repeat-containing protein n=1 Tax=Luteolibacter arcticus TaxID=1581411 RepID=A0ABT3GR01_9BACT|nr:LamG-like jellyroll fold domain-containing protein [Luteolibacter arcticus]MCW1925901.1 InlB B-repeat-containing protein [Luteolibacter arcticus]